MAKSAQEGLTRRTFLGAAAAAGAGISAASGAVPGPVAGLPGQADPGWSGTEPSMADGLRWWRELPEKWTPFGWKDHMFRFNVLYEGTIVADPFTNQRTERYRGEGVYLSFAPAIDAVPARSYYKQGDDNAVAQGWTDRPTPELWSEWTTDGFITRCHAFAHVTGGRPVESGIEPIFAWIRLSLHATCEALPLEERWGFLLRLNAPHIGHTMSIRNNLIPHPEDRRYPPQYRSTGYPRRLYAEPEEYDRESGLVLLERSVWEGEEEARVRLMILPGFDCSAVFKPRHPEEMDSSIYVEMDAKPGAHVDILLPMLPSHRSLVEPEARIGYDRALQEADHFWSWKPETAAVFETPEIHINKTVEYGLKFAEMIAEKNPDNGQYSLLTGSWVYANLWATPLAFCSIWFLDCLGYHSTVEKYLEIFRREQGTVVPPGDHYTLHPGYLSTPASLTAINWLSDHGALLYTLSAHGLLSGNGEWVQDRLSTILKACEFIRDARAIKGHGGFEGIMPPGIATDRRTKIQAIWNDGWMYKGLTTAVRLLRRIGHPRAGEFAAEAEGYRQAFHEALAKKTETMPDWTDNAGKKHRLVPTSLQGETKSELRHAFYLDTGPLFLVFAGLLRADDEMMRSMMQWFREGPQTRLYRFDSNCWQVPRLIHEVSSCEPNMSWGYFHSHQLGDRARFLEAMYSLFACHVSRQTYTNCETRGGVTGLTPTLTEYYLARLAVVDDQVEPDGLHLLRLMPLAWLAPDKPSRFENMPTEFGPLSLGVSRAGESLEVTYEARYRIKPSRVVLHVPPLGELNRVRLNGRDLAWDRSTRTAQIG